MFVRKKHYENAIQKVRIEVGKELGLESADEAYVIFREPSEKEVIALRSAKDDDERLDAFYNIFCHTLREHNFFEEEGIKMEDKAVVDLLFEKIDTATKLMEEYSTQLFRSRANRSEEK